MKNNYAEKHYMLWTDIIKFFEINSLPKKKESGKKGYVYVETSNFVDYILELMPTLTYKKENIFCGKNHFDIIKEKIVKEKYNDEELVNNCFACHCAKTVYYAKAMQDGNKRYVNDYCDLCPIQMACYSDFSPYERVVRAVNRFMEDKELHNALYKSIIEYNKPLTSKEEDKLNNFECDLQDMLDIMDEIRENRWYMYRDVISMAHEETL